jgi:hypothetical protein
MIDTQTTPEPYTPTPWYASGLPDEYPFEAINADGPKTVANIIRSQQTTEESRANARLIASAVNSYAKHCGPNAIQCAEDDLLGQALEVIRFLVVDAEYRSECMNKGEDDPGEDLKALTEARRLLARLPQ